MHGQVKSGFQSEQTFWDIHKENSRKPEHNIVINVQQLFAYKYNLQLFTYL